MGTFSLALPDAGATAAPNGSNTVPELVEPSVERRSAWLEFHREWGPDSTRTASGHIGYGIRPSARGRGIATWALEHVLGLAKEHALERVLLVCADSNAASIRTIERCGGVPDGTVDDAHGPLRHYWIRL